MQLITVLLITGITLAFIGMFMGNSHPNHPQ